LRQIFCFGKAKQNQWSEPDANGFEFCNKLGTIPASSFRGFMEGALQSGVTSVGAGAYNDLLEDCGEV
jgi:hypothetical protein